MKRSSRTPQRPKAGTARHKSAPGARAPVVGLTGAFGTGKSSVAAIFRSLGATVIDADRMAHRCIRTGTPAYRAIVAIFGRSILTAGGAIDRRRLGRLVFADRRLLTRLERIVHPHVVGAIRERIAAARPGKRIVIDAPLLIETGLHRLVDVLVVVTARRTVQIARCRRKYGMTENDVTQRMAHQLPLAAKVRLAAYVINNNGTRTRTRAQARKVWRSIWK